MAKDLNKLFNYRIKVKVKYEDRHIKIFKFNHITSEDDWGKSQFKTLKAFIKRHYYYQQQERCAYCRRSLTLVGKGEHIDHFIPKSYFVGYMFKPVNLVLTCALCNPTKKDKPTIRSTYTRRRYPKKKTDFICFNPHYDSWGSCFKIEEGMFIKARNRKGDQLIKICKLYLENYSVEYIRESNISNKTALRRASVYLSRSHPDSVEYKSAKKLVDHYTNLI